MTKPKKKPAKKKAATKKRAAKAKRATKKAATKKTTKKSGKGWSPQQRAAYDAARAAGRTHQQAFGNVAKAGKTSSANVAKSIGMGIAASQKKPKKKGKRKKTPAQPIHGLTTRTTVPIMDRKEGPVLRGKVVTGHKRDSVMLQKMMTSNKESARILARYLSGKKKPPAVIVTGRK